MNKHTILKYINKPSKILLWDFDEAMSFLLPFGLFCLEGRAMLGLLLGFGMFNSVKFAKSRGRISALSHLTYWYLPAPLGRLKVRIESYKREYIG